MPIQLALFKLYFRHKVYKGINTSVIKTLFERVKHIHLSQCLQKHKKCLISLCAASLKVIINAWSIIIYKWDQEGLEERKKQLCFHQCKGSSEGIPSHDFDRLLLHWLHNKCT